MTTEGDAAFTQLNMKLDRSILPVGQYAYAENKRVSDGHAADRAGTIRPNFANMTHFGSILGAGIYSNPNGEETLLVATPGAIYAVRDGATPAIVPMPGGTTLARPAEFVQAHNRILLFRGPKATTLVWDGLALEGFTALAKAADDPASVDALPNAETAEYFRNRLLVPYKEGFALGDSGELVYDRILGYFRINAGEADTVVRLFPFASGTVLIFKRRKLFAISNFTGLDPSVASLETLNASLGCAARRSVAQVGGDAFFLSDPGGVYRVQQVLENRLQAAPMPVSDPIQPLIDRINWDAASGAVAAVLGEYYYLAVPLDGSATNNAILVYNTVSQGWESCDTWAGAFQISDLRVTLYGGTSRLFALDFEAAAIYLLYEGKSDFLAGGEVRIRSRFETRGYAELPENSSGKRLPTVKRTRRVQLALATWHPSYTVTALSDGVNEEQLLTPQPVTRDRRTYLTFGRRDFDPTNVNDDFDVAQREDYSVDPDLDGGVDLGANGIEIERKQETIERYPLRVMGRHISLRIENTQGECTILSASVESDPAMNSYRRAA